ncbi:MAG: chemotaxis protein CheW, partial [Longimicrobiales bacterium]|nr:chemotaxis protein CheW [Longimicrobiales bacterium]
MNRVTDEVVAATRAVRLRPFREACDHLPRTARDVAAATGKEVDLFVEDHDVEVDRAVVDALRNPLTQLVRNAVDHGIETPGARREAGKEPRGVVRIRARSEADRLTVEVSDDGAGIDVEGLKQKLPGGLPGNGDDGLLVDVLMKAGVSTRAEAGPISGRGVGLDIVREAVAGIHGAVGVRWKAGRGTTFEIETPVSLATSVVLLLSVQSWTMAVPARYVERVMLPRSDEIRRAQGKDLLVQNGSSLPLSPLARLLGAPFHDRASGPESRIVLIRSGGHRAAILVDAVLDARELLIERATPPGVKVPLVTGAATLPSGEVVPVLDVPRLLVARGWGAAGTSSPLVQDEHNGERARVMVVDDSITMRKVTSRVLEGHDFEVMTARDGVDALEQLQDRTPDIML